MSAGAPGKPRGSDFTRTLRGRYVTARRAETHRHNRHGRRPVATRVPPLRVKWTLPTHRTKIRRLTQALSTGLWQKDTIADRASRALHGGPPDPRRLTARLLLQFGDAQHPPPAELEAFLRHDHEVASALRSITDNNTPALLLDPSTMQPQRHRISLPLPVLDTVRDLQQWLGVSAGELAWFADCDGRQAKSTTQRLHHYRYRWAEKRRGGWRLIEQPKSRLKAIQRQVLREILDRVPPHPAAHGFRRGRSCLSFVAPHCGRPLLLRLDLRDYFTRVPVARIGATFRRLGYPAAVAHTLQGLCTHAMSASLADPPAGAVDWQQRQYLRSKHLPQGAPTSPALANLCSWHLDARLSGLAHRYGLAYTRYADDLAFSGTDALRHDAPFLRDLIAAIALEEGFRINHRKTRLVTAAQRQRLTGIVINAHPNPPRSEFDRLRATLFNCVRYGPQSQNRDARTDFAAYLAGKLAYVTQLNPNKAVRLHRLWRQIDWQEYDGTSTMHDDGS